MAELALVNCVASCGEGLVPVLPVGGGEVFSPLMDSAVSVGMFWSVCGKPVC